MLREVAQYLGVDATLVSKFESGARKPTREQVNKYTEILDLDEDALMVEWLKARILKEIGYDEIALKAMVAAEVEIKYTILKKALPHSVVLKGLLTDIDKLKVKLDALRKFDSYKIAQSLELEYTFESNRIEGNTLTLNETNLVINEGLTISGKSMREHLEAINHNEAIEYIKYLIEKKSNLNERELLTIHNLILRGIDSANAGVYRKVQVMIQGSSFTPPQPYRIAKDMEDYFIWYNAFKTKLHPVILAAEMHERLVTIHPFIDGNGRTSRLVMNLILLKHGYAIANIKGDASSRLAYYNALEKSQTQNVKDEFVELIAFQELNAIERHLNIVAH